MREASTVESVIVELRMLVRGGGMLMAEAEMGMMRLLSVASQR